MKIAGLAFTGFIVCWGLLLAIGYTLCKATNHAVPRPADIRFDKIDVNEIQDKHTTAWILEGRSGKGFILAHGNSSDRNSMVPRAGYLNSLGYTVIMPDLNSHGETIGKWKTFGFIEARD